MNRRQVLGTAAVAVTVPGLAACAPVTEASPSRAEPTPSASDAASSAAPEPSSGGGGFATTADVPSGSGAIFEDEGVVVTQPTDGEFKGFSNICTHQGCAVSEVTDSIHCPCHDSHFSITDGSVISGPATEPLPAVEIVVDGDEISKA